MQSIELKILLKKPSLKVVSTILSEIIFPKEVCKQYAEQHNKVVSEIIFWKQCFVSNKFHSPYKTFVKVRILPVKWIYYSFFNKHLIINILYTWGNN